MPAMSTAGIASADEDVPTAIPTPEANEEAYLFFEYFLKYNGLAVKEP